MEISKKMVLLSNVFELEEDELTPEMDLDNIESWDSVTKLSLIVMVEEEFGKILNADIIRKFTTVSDILEQMCD